MLFEFCAYLTGLAILVCMLLALVRHRDPLHPMVYIGAMLIFRYSFLPLYLALTQGEQLRGFFSVNDLIYVQVLSGLGALSLCAGMLAGSGPAHAWYAARPPMALTPVVHRRLVIAALVLGGIGVAGYLYPVMNAGGFGAAYGEGYGGGSTDSGYIRGASLLAISALLLLMAAHSGRRMSRVDWLWILAFASPFLLHGLLGARRGQIFMLVMALWVGWYFMRGRRPRLVTCALVGVPLGLLMLFLIANRDELHLGSDLSFERGIESYVFQVRPGNEFVYGAGAILHADARDEYWWGRRYAVVLFVRPIPRAIWPSKYEDASTVLSIPNLEVGNHMGVGGTEFPETLGWEGGIGAQPGIVSDMWIEFWFGAFAVLFVIGWCYGSAWSRAVRRGGIWMIIYCMMACFSVYIVTQTLEAMLFRFLLAVLPAALAWRYAFAPVSRSLHDQQAYRTPGMAR